MSILLIAAALASAATPQRELRVCADPNNLPFSNRAGEGFENKLAEVIAADLGAKLTYIWWAQRRGNVRESLNERRCDLIPGIGSNLEMLATTRPYYRSTYVAVTRRGLDVATFDDPKLRTLKIGVQMIGDDFANTPPAHALARRRIIDNVRGYMVYGDYGQAAPQVDIVSAVASGEIDVAFVWGPVAGYFAKRQTVPLKVVPVKPRFDSPLFPMLFDVSVGMRKGDLLLKAEVEQVLANRSSAIRALLVDYGVPLVEE